MSVTPQPDERVAQLIDANLDRAREGLRVIEDWCRFYLKDKELVITIKNWRQQLGQQHFDFYKRARCASADRGAGISHSIQEKRTLPKEIVAANFGRVQEALRVLEEFSRPWHSELSEITANMRYKVYDLEVVILKSSTKRKLDKKLRECKLCLITKPHKELIRTVSLALQAGVTMIQYRCKEGTDLESFSIAKEISDICKKHESLFIVNDRLDIALATDADGIHLGQEDLPVEIARNILGAEKLIGQSTHSLEQIEIATNKSFDYLGIGPIFKTNSKPGENELGVDFLKDIASQVSIPWFAIGGVNSTNIIEVNNAGAKRIAVINAIMESKDPYLASKGLLEKIK
ncbi:MULTISPECIES: thiamine phosphate synthase [unclassified Prochlorococcus]|uniref:thiamine phosphate synthase n=1 Tax=unclassified Prochlorococcus TaxID=2627481 RepID=UPI000533A1AB|nr:MULTISPECIES: thiamine phosphate synthase [unclassified Prochlorococcus]KGG16297.1 Thiamin-phosphate pyrophosphorylase [Prochlorococcus sp. MIT 0603]KGG17969.1 Thiamin-phosphate pyrophosphorylase [Prochlorococcus sp. MIT 0602]